MAELVDLRAASDCRSAEHAEGSEQGRHDDFRAGRQDCIAKETELGILESFRFVNLFSSAVLKMRKSIYRIVLDKIAPWGLMIAFLFFPWIAVLIPMCKSLHKKGWSWQVFTGLEYRWQTLIVGAITVQTALVGGCFIYLQIRRDNRAEREAQRRRFEAEIAALPMILSDLIDFLEKCARSAADLLEEVQKCPPTRPPRRSPQLPSILIQQIKTLIERGDNELTRISQRLLRLLQIHGSRMRSLSQSHGFPGYSPPVKQEILNVLSDTAELHAIVEKLFPFARDESDRPEDHVSVGDIQASSRKMLWCYADIGGLEDTIARRFRHNPRSK